jgi:3-keto-5-aminohexanoate cleavage enzyme
LAIFWGKVRVSIIYYSRGVPARTNAEFVERIVRIAREYGREIATPEEARRILKLN